MDSKKYSLSSSYIEVQNIQLGENLIWDRITDCFCKKKIKCIPLTTYFWKNSLNCPILLPQYFICLKTIWSKGKKKRKISIIIWLGKMILVNFTNSLTCYYLSVQSHNPSFEKSLQLSDYCPLVTLILIYYMIQNPQNRVFNWTCRTHKIGFSGWTIRPIQLGPTIQYVGISNTGKEKFLTR